MRHLPAKGIPVSMNIRELSVVIVGLPDIRNNQCVLGDPITIVNILFGYAVRHTYFVILSIRKHLISGHAYQWGLHNAI
jgi:hypothetical protein